MFERLVQVTTGGCLSYMLVMLFLDPELGRISTTLLIAVAGPVALMLLRRGQQRLGFSVFLWTVWATICLQTVLRSGILNSSLHANAVLILMTGWLLGMRQAMWLWLASVGWAGVLALNSSFHWWTPLSTPNAGIYWLAMTCVWSIGFFVMRLIFNANQQRMQEIETLNAALHEKVQALALQEQATRLNEQRVTQVLMASPLPITVGSFEGGAYIDVNPAWERTFGHRREDVIGKTSVDLGFWRDLTERQGWLDQFARAGRVSGHEVNFKMRDGSTRTFLLSSERFLYGDKECALTMSMDVTERKRLESELRELNAHLEQRVAERTQAVDQSNRELVHAMAFLQKAQDELVQSEKLASLGSLVAGVAHELNTPLGNALVTTSALHERLQATQQAVATGQLKKSTLDAFMRHAQEGVTLTQRSLARAVDLIASFKKVAVDQASERRRTFDLEQMLHEVVDTLRPNIRQAHISLSLDLQPGLALDSFPGPLGQVVINLVMNAVTHAFEGRDSGTITVTTQSLEGQRSVRIQVTDDGVGIAPQHVTQVFDPFFTTRMGQGGSGLGLSISRRIVTKILGGQLTVHSSVGKGSTFEIVLPLIAPDVVN
jgi:PAS domain S-box-containing protein